MNIKLTKKIIEDMCGTVSFKRGDSFFRANKVSFQQSSSDQTFATVTGKEDFHVTLKKDRNGDLQSKCSCPKLASFDKDCQHIAAVLLSIYAQQRNGATPISLNPGSDQVLTNGLLTLFDDQPIRKSGHQLHFEKRQVIDAQFTWKPVGKEQQMLAVEVRVGQTNVENVRAFLAHVKKGLPIKLSNLFTYDPNIHCFSMETDAVMMELAQNVVDEKISNDESLLANPSHQLLISPSYWDRLVPLLERAPLVKLEYGGNIFEGLNRSKEQLSLRFDFNKAEDKGFQLIIDGLKQMVVLSSYQSVLADGKLSQLKADDCKRLSDLKVMLEASGTNRIPIPNEQSHFFLEKVVPGLRRLGEFHISSAIAHELVKKPLSAKLFLDRVNNKLLAGLEFHYEHIVLNPLESREPKSGSALIRDYEKEEVILEMMEESSFAKTDGGYLLHNEELEYQFLNSVVPKLQKFVQIYATTAVKMRIFKGNIPPRIRIKLQKERTNWLEFKFELDGIPENDIREVLEALEEKRKYYRLRNGSLMSLETKEFEEMQQFLQALPIQKEDLESTLNLPIVRGLQLIDSVNEGSLFTIEESFTQFLEKIRHPERLGFEVPESLKLTLRDYQIHGFKWMKQLASLGFGGILADDMGLGKTLQSITFIVSALPEIREKKQPVLIVCPSSLTYNWLSELMKFAPDIQAVVVDGQKHERMKIQKDMTDCDVLIISYPLLRRDIKWFEKQNFHTVFFDEAQAFKNPVTQTARAVKKIQASQRFALTGTPVENSLEELWSIFHVVFPELFQGLKQYSNLTRKTIARRIRPFLLRRMKEDVLLELPEKIELTQRVELLAEQKKLYAAYLAKLKNDTLKHLDKDTIRKNKIKILAGLTRLRQICCHPALFVDSYKGSSAKFELLLQILEEAKLSGRRVLIFSQFTKMLGLISRELADQGRAFFYLDGQTPSEERVETCTRFNSGERDLFLISLKAGGTGLNLTGADTVILYDLWWNPAVEEQAADRAHRIGQTNVVQVIKLVTRGSIEEKIDELQEKKRHLIEQIIDEKTSTTLTEDDIREILMI
ncbi:SNF2 helicase associated domain-containing protein [Anaerobacillus isosaccharinicus]|uniref:SNF2 helicase associated domain-containing protein n=1 Tax=Anaerobacillus isosaccharinicus TaxID=1532552 RepID=A0A7S7L623_9BACI|nr:DEAD/DEAH box helicase [Anaerobacillus isosaccharinicus]MBA5586634.1 SNF2 helicase associated domain-containing protein [Anaerobacillus isosaccharinicus]QOY35132.1 SNF2 helicase associated domain-containing protein [Anaerobacillus isosaccharinicus]